MTSSRPLNTGLADDRGEASSNFLNIVGLTIAGCLIVFGLAFPTISASFTEMIGSALPATDTGTSEAVTLSAPAGVSSVMASAPASELIDAVRAAEATAFAQNGVYADSANLVANGLVDAATVDPAAGGRVLLGPDASCYVVLVHGPDTIRFYTTSKLDGMLSVTGAVSADTGWCLNP